MRDYKAAFEDVRQRLSLLHDTSEASCSVTSHAIGPLDYELNTEPEEFLSDAEEDITLGSPKGWRGALTNAKRAIDAQVDKALLCFGFKTSRKKMPEKLELLKHIGIVSPRIIKKVVDLRNELEHEFKSPSKDQAEEATDVATLFVAAVDRTLSHFPFIFEMHVPNPDYREQDDKSYFKVLLWVEFDFIEKKVSGSLSEGLEEGFEAEFEDGMHMITARHLDSFVFDFTDPRYVVMLRIALWVSRQKHRMEKIERFRKLFTL